MLQTALNFRRKIAFQLLASILRHFKLEGGTCKYKSPEAMT